MKTRHLTIAAISTLAILGQACSNSAEDNSTIAFATIHGSAAYRLDNSAQDFDRDSDIIYFDSASIILPTVIYNQDITGLQDSIMKAAFDTICTDHVAAMKSSFGKYAGESGYNLTEIPAGNDMLYGSGGVTLVSGNVFSLSPKLLTYRVSSYNYPAGAAHGLTTNRYITYDILDARIISLDFIFTPEGLKQLPAVIAQKAASMKSQIGATEITALPSGGNFYIDLSESIVFVYEPYEVASYAQGEIAIPFYPYQLSDYMTAEALNLFNLHDSVQ